MKMIQKIISIKIPTIVSLIFLHQIYYVMSVPLKNRDLSDVSTTEELESMNERELDETLRSTLLESTSGTRKLFGNVLPYSNVAGGALNNNQIVFGNFLPNSNPSVSASDSSNHPVGQGQPLASNPLSGLQSLTGNILPGSNPTVEVGSQSQMFGNILPNSNSMVSTSDSMTGGQTPPIADSNPLSEVQNNAANGNLNVGLGKGAFNRNIIGTSPVLLLGTQQALLIPIDSIPSIFQNMLSGLMSMDASQQNANPLSQLPIKSL